MKGLLFICLFTSLFFSDIQAQYRSSRRPIPYSEIGLGAGAAIYLGDLAPPSQLAQSIYPLPRWSTGLSYTHHLSPHVATRASFTWIRLTGDDYTYNKDDPYQRPIQFQRNLHFRNDVKELALSGIYQFKPETIHADQRPALTPYLMLGVAVIAHNPKALLPTSVADRATSGWVALQPLGTEGQGQPGYSKPYPLITLAIPAGAGLRWRLTERLNLATEVTIRYTFTDYLDDVGGLYPNRSDLHNPQSNLLSDRRFENTAARTGEDRTALLTTLINVPTNVRRGTIGNDLYLTIQASIHYLLTASIKCPPHRQKNY
jgi:hypothetical protein